MFGPSGRMPSVMSHSFSEVPRAEIPRSVFNRSHGHKTTFDAGYLVPVLVDEALPGDTFQLRASLFVRLMTPAVPFMDNLRLDAFFFAVPIRLIWNNWQKFNGEQVDPDDSTDYLVPSLDPTQLGSGFAVGSLSDYFGLPTDVALNGASAPPVVSLWHRAYNLIWNEWFRDQNLQDSVVVDKDDGPDDIAAYVLLKRGKRHDYFTSCLPWPQKGDAVELPLGTSAPVVSAGDGIPLFNTTGAPATQLALKGTSGSANMVWSQNATETQLAQWNTTKLETDLSTATAATINELRQAFQVQKLYERDARGGTRYTEIIRSHFGVVSPDARLQRPEYLGGGSTVINVHPIPQTSSTDATTPQGNLAAFATSSASGIGFTKSFTEHCVLLGMVCVRADLNYQQGLPRMFSRQSRWDFYWPALAHLGEQAVLNKEIYCQGTADDDAVFGYQERYAEYRYKPSQITGKMRSTAAGSLDVWHLAQEFGSLPVLDATFIQETPPIDRVIAVVGEPALLLDSYFDMKCARPMPTYSVPGMIDHF